MEQVEIRSHKISPTYCPDKTFFESYHKKGGTEKRF